MLHAFQGGHDDGAVPGGDVIVDRGGAHVRCDELGRASTIRAPSSRLEPTAGGYTLTLLHNFGRAGDGQGPPV